ncbi:MAG: hypothetical protein ACTSWY_13375 [Promethearchaeota archaeon]
MSPEQVDKETGKELPDSNELLNIIMMVLGVLFIIQGVLNILSWFGVLTPGWLTAITSGDSGQAAMALLGQSGLVTTLLGVWCFISGVGMMREEEWAWGVALIVLSIMFVNALGSLIGWITAPTTFEIGNFTTWITLIGLIVAVLGFLWLIFTKKRYA